ncbi:MAG: hypothetical protein HYZ37_14060, partial [Candidatus Solibacter usitatus]|nr:hypothetical protein [Candidatus Solibacter usitatus]
KDAMRDAVSLLNMRNGFDEVATGQRTYVRTVQLQYGIGRNWRNLNKHHSPVIVKELADLDSANFSKTFHEFWEVYKRLSSGALDMDAAWGRLDGNPWLPSGGKEDLGRLLMRSRQDSMLDGVFGEPEVHWTGGVARLRLRLRKGIDRLLDGESFSLSLVAAERTWRYDLRRNGGDSGGFSIVRPTGDNTYIDIPLGSPEVSVRVRSTEGATCIEQEITVFGDSELTVFDGASGRPIESCEDGVRVGLSYTILFDHPEWKWNGGSNLEQAELAGGWRAILVSPSDEDAALIVDGEQLWPSPYGERSGRSAQPTPHVMASCDGTDWGELAKVRIYPIPPTLEPVSFLLLGSVYELAMDSANQALARIPVSPALLIDESTLRPRLVAWDRLRERKRVIACKWSPPRLSGFVVSINCLWEPIRDICDCAVLERSTIRRVHQADGHDKILDGGEYRGIVDGEGILKFAGKLSGWGESIRVCTGPNEVQYSQVVVRSVGDAGRISHIDFLSGSEILVSFRSSSYEFDADRHQIEIWFDGEEAPVGTNFISAEEKGWRVQNPDPSKKTIGIAVFFGTIRVGSRWIGDLCPTELVQLVRRATDWPHILSHLIRWKAPLLHHEIIRYVHYRCASEPAAVLSALVQGHPHEECSEKWHLLREMLAAWTPAASDAEEIIASSNILPREAFDLKETASLDGFRVAILAEPAAVSGLISLGLSAYYKEVRREDLEAIIKLLLNATLKNADASRIEQERMCAQKEMDLDERFLSETILGAARLRGGMFGPDDKPQPWQRKALLYCLASAHVSRWLAASLLFEFQQKLVDQPR